MAIQDLYGGGDSLKVNTVSTTCDDQGAVAVRSGSQHLFASSLTTSNGSASKEFILFEDPSGDIALLYRSLYSYGYGGLCFPWIDITKSLVSTLSSAFFGSPFASTLTDKVVFTEQPGRLSFKESSGGFNWVATFYDARATWDKNLIFVAYNLSTQSFSAGKRSISPSDSVFII